MLRLGFAATGLPQRSPGERAGFLAAADAHHIDHAELVWVQSNETLRLFRQREEAVLRGMMITAGPDRVTLFTRGSVDFYRLYPGMYVPAPISLRLAETESSAEYLASEILALTKMNWNQSQLDGRLPITLRAARRVADILKHVDPASEVASRYAFYM